MPKLSGELKARRKPELLAKTASGAVVPGQKYNQLTAIKRGTIVRSRSRLWLCECDCGNYLEITGWSLRTGDVKSCRECGAKRRVRKIIKHGLARTGNAQVYMAWRAMIDRCYNPKNYSYRNYGKRGINVCQEWVESVERFAADMGTRPSGGTLERKNNNGNYEPANCCWKKMKEQANNKRTNVRISFNGKTQTISQWRDELGFGDMLINQRLERGWSIEDALTVIPGTRQKQLCSNGHKFVDGSFYIHKKIKNGVIHIHRKCKACAKIYKARANNKANHD